MLSKDTQLCISMSGRPSNIGTRFHNRLYDELGLDFVYKAFSPVDLAQERKTGDFLRTLIRAGRIDTAHDCSDGGLAVAVAEMALASGMGAELSAEGDAGEIIRTFGEFVISGNLIVGLVVFLIITLVQFIVIAKGAERVAEVLRTSTAGPAALAVLNARGRWR